MLLWHAQLSVAVNSKVHRQMLKLGTESFDDSSTVKSMMLVALIYLPASFVSVSLSAHFPDPCSPFLFPFLCYLRLSISLETT